METMADRTKSEALGLAALLKEAASKVATMRDKGIGPSLSVAQRNRLTSALKSLQNAEFKLDDFARIV